jgi:hypothetical protein
VKLSKLGQFVVVLLALVGWPISAAIAQCTFDGECDPRYPFKSLCANYFCNDGQCSGPVAVNCDDKNVCTIDGCSEQRAGCFHDPKCHDDGLVCNGEEYCCTTIFCQIVGLYGQCRHRGVDCVDSNPCTCDGCQEPTGCLHAPINCNDGDVCSADRCEQSTPDISDDCNTVANCLHDPIQSCCRNSAECQEPCQTGRTCVGNVCTSGETLSCDDANPLTVDACDPATGCTHAAVTTTTLPGFLPCRGDGDCASDADPCTVESCDPTAGCVSRSLSGFQGLTCVCGRTDPASCGATKIPRNVNTKRRRGCTLIVRAMGKESSKAQAKLVGRAGKVLTAAQRRLAKAKAVSDQCRNDLGAVLSDVVTRVGVLRDQL